MVQFAASSLLIAGSLAVILWPAHLPDHRSSSPESKRSDSMVTSPIVSAGLKQPATAPLSEAARARATLNEMLHKGVDFLLSQQCADGSWSAGVHNDAVLTTSISMLAITSTRPRASRVIGVSGTRSEAEAVQHQQIVFQMLATVDDPSIPGGVYRENHILAVAMNLNAHSDASDNQWRLDLIARLASSQNKDGSWGGESDPTEHDRVLATAYAVWALAETRNGLPR